jgi:uncharacterized protein YbjT (DUF2867 family)
VYECTGPRLLGFDEAMAEISSAIGREVRFQDVGHDEFAAGLAATGMPAADAEGLAYLFADVLDGHNSSLTDGVQRALGRPARDFTEYVRRTVATGAWDV